VSDGVQFLLPPEVHVRRLALTSLALTTLAAGLALTPSAAADDGQTAADPADGYIAYMENAGEEFNPKLRVLAKDPDGTNKRVLEKNAVDVAIYDPTVSPNGKYLAFNSGNEVYVMQIGKRKSLKRVETFGDFPSEAAWAPDSSEFMFTTVLPPFFDARDIVVADTRGRWRQVTETPVDEFDAAWSPDGDWIAFTAQGSRGCTDGSQVRRFRDIYLSRPNGSGRTLVTQDVSFDWQVEDWGATGILANASYAGASGVIADPCPADGRRAHLVDADEGSATPIMGGLTDRALALSPDETGVLFHRAAGGKDSVWVADVDGTDQRKIAKNTFTADWAAYPPGD
jgi:dipeptidyl aminopeptidase/acylaminoacyl peptidase